MDWTAIDLPQVEYKQEVAYGSRDVYLAVTGSAEVRLTRWRRMSPSFTEAQAARNVIVFPLGRGPGRPGGEPELAALTESAKRCAERFEAGEDIDGCPYWRHERSAARFMATGNANDCPNC